MDIELFNIHLFYTTSYQLPMKPRYILFSITLLSISLVSHAQTVTDALRYSQFNNGLSTARMSSLAGAFGAMGEDIGGISINPAGLASFRRSEFSFSPNYNFNNSEANLINGPSIDDSNSQFGLGNIGVVFANQPIASAFTTSNWSIAINKRAIFSQDFRIAGSNQGSITDRWAARAFGLLPSELDNFEAGPAWDVFALYDRDGDTYLTDFDNYDGNVPKSETTTRRGRINELSFGWAGNINRKFSIGANIGIPIMSYETTKTYRESDDLQEIDFFDRLSYTEYISTSGAGINAKLGIQYVGLQNFRLGAAVHTPTVYGLSDNFFTNIDYTYTDANGVESNTSRSPDGNFDYRMTTPWTYIASAGFIYKLGAIRGFINADVEFIDYSYNSFNLTSSDRSSDADAEFETQLNGQIEDELNNVMNIRLGTELGYHALRFRAGISLDESPYTDESVDDNLTVGLGIGIEKRSFSFDLGLQSRQQNEEYYLYQVNAQDNSQQVDLSSNITDLTATLAFRF